MSSDSDLDFESADEDTEFTMKAKNKECVEKVSDLKDVSTTEIEESIETVNEHVNSDDSIKKIECQNFNRQAEKESNNKIHLEHSTSDVKGSENDTVISNVDEAGSIPEASVSMSREETASVSSEITSNSECRDGKQRVVLRLEKKKQQKNQLFKESSVEKEKPSDLINILEDNSKQEAPWGWSSWGTSLLSTAASSVSTFSSQVSQGIGTVLETVESTLGAPPPEELAEILKEKKESSPDCTNEADVELKNQDSKSGLLPDISSWTKVLENTGTKVIAGGLDTLEFIGKKTMDILTEGDPGLRIKRSAFAGTANLSELLREIKARADEQDVGSDSEQGNLHYSQIFDEKQGLVHLEALEMLSKQSQAKFQRLLMRHSKDSEVKKRLEAIKSICEDIPSLDDPAECENFEDFEVVFKKHSVELSLPLNVENILKVQREIDATIKNLSNLSEETKKSPNEIFQSGICNLAEFTAKCIETFHKVAELILVQTSVDTDLEQCATNLTGLTTVMCIEVNNISSKYHKCLEAISQLHQNSSNEAPEVNTLATNLYLEAANSNNYIQDAYQMLVPVLQVRLLETID